MNVPEPYSTPADRSRQIWLPVVATIALVALVLAGWAVINREPSSTATAPTAQSGPAGQPTGMAGVASTAGAPGASAANPPATVVVTVTATPTKSLPVGPATGAAPDRGGELAPSPPGADPGAMVRNQPGTGCEPTAVASGYGSYQRAVCTSMRAYEGIGGEILRAGRTWVVCQRNLGLPNPVYVAGQTNTWWFFTKSDNGMWGWFPHTLLAQGSDGRPINGIPLCS